MILMADGRRPFLRTSWAVSNWTKVPRPSFTVMHPFDASVNKKFSKSILIDVDSRSDPKDNHTTLQDHSILLRRGSAHGRTPGHGEGPGPRMDREGLGSFIHPACATRAAGLQPSDLTGKHWRFFAVFPRRACLLEAG